MTPRQQRSAVAAVVCALLAIASAVDARPTSCLLFTIAALWTTILTATPDRRR